MVKLLLHCTPQLGRESTARLRKTCTGVRLQVAPQWSQKCFDFDNNNNKNDSRQSRDNVNTYSKRPLPASPANQGNLIGPVVKGSRQVDLFAVTFPAKDGWSV